jgi:hypothetical protein
VIAALFLLTAATAIYGVILLDPILNSPDYLAKAFPNKAVIALGSLI